MYVFYVVLIILSFAYAGFFPRYFIHVYEVGHRKIIGSFSIGIAGAIGLMIFMSMLPKENQTAKAFLLTLPVLVLGFSTGCALMAGLIGMNGGRYRFIAIIIFGGMSMVAEFIVPIYSTFVYSGVCLYGLGATLLSLGESMEPEKEEEAEEGEEDNTETDGMAKSVKRKKLNINWDDMD